MIFQLPSFWCWKMPISGASERTVTLEPSFDSSVEFAHVGGDPLINADARADDGAFRNVRTG
jgi:hypothetical protein